MRVAEEAIRAARAQAEHPTRDWSGWCLKFTRKMLGLPWVADSAIEAWQAVRPGDRHPGAAPPPGVPVFWSIGEHGHVALSDGGGRVWSTDVRRPGKVDLVPITEVRAAWGARYLGWAETLGPFRVLPDPAREDEHVTKDDIEAIAKAVLQTAAVRNRTVEDEHAPGARWTLAQALSWVEERTERIEATQRDLNTKLDAILAHVTAAK